MTERNHGDAKRSSPRRMLLVANEAPWPPVHGGRTRTAEVALSLAEQSELIVAFPSSETAFLTAQQELLALRIGLLTHCYRFPPPNTGARDLAERLLPHPRLGLRALRQGRPQLDALVGQWSPEVILWSHSYLAAVGIPMVADPHAVHVVDFANIESERFRSIAARGSLVNRAAAQLEALKADRWEPRVARDAAVSLALTTSDLHRLRGWGANAVYAPNGMSVRPYTPSPDNRHVMSAGNWTYAPNITALSQFVATDWPRVLAHEPEAELHLYGKGSVQLERLSAPGVVKHGFVDSLDAPYRDASVVLAPAQVGGGSQLKVAEALCHGRVVVGPRHLEREQRPGLPAGAVIPSDDVVTTLLSLWNNSYMRHHAERLVADFARSNDWSGSLASARGAVEQALSVRRARK